MKLKVLTVLLTLFIFLPLSACRSRELNTMSLIMALGIDKDETGYMVTYQVLNPKPVAAKKSVNEAPFVIYTEKGNNLDEIEKRVTTQASRMIYAAHIRSILIGEEMARDGLKEILDYLYRSNEYRTDYYFIIAKGTTANQILSTVTTIESVSGRKLHESIDNSKKWWPTTNSLKIIELINDINVKGNNPALAGVEFYNNTENMNNIDTLTKSNPGKLKFTAMGAFHDDKLVGWLDESESIALSIILGKAKHSTCYVDYDKDTKVFMEMYNKKPKIKVSLSDGKPAINVTLKSEMNIATENGSIDFTDQANMDKLISLADGKIIDTCKKTLNKAQNELKTDIFGFGESIHQSCPKVWNKLKDNWDNDFTKLQVNFTANTKFMNMGQNLKSIINKED